jgi:hypothetical protein
MKEERNPIFTESYVMVSEEGIRKSRDPKPEEFKKIRKKYLLYKDFE